MSSSNSPSRRAILQGALFPFAFGHPTQTQELHRDYDEAKIRRCTLPDPVLLLDGQRVDSASIWQQRRRPELLRLFEANIYGRSPGRPSGLSFEVRASDANVFGGKAERKVVAIRFSKQSPQPWRM